MGATPQNRGLVGELIDPESGKTWLRLTGRPQDVADAISIVMQNFASPINIAQIFNELHVEEDPHDQRSEDNS